MNDSEQARTLRWPGDPATVAAAEMDFEAVAHVLGNTCCWGGRSRRFYSLAQHALTVSGAIDRLGGMNEEDRRVLSLHALLADAWRAWVREDPGAQPSGKAAAQARRSEKAAVRRAVLEAARSRHRVARGLGRCAAVHPTHGRSGCQPRPARGRYR